MMQTPHLLPVLVDEHPTALHWAPTEPAPLAEVAGRILPGGHVAQREGAALRLLQQPVHSGAPRLIKKLLAAQSAREREHHVRNALQGCGFDWYAYFRLECGASGPRLRDVVDTYAHRDWIQRYFEARHHEVDPRLRLLVGSRLPVAWNCADLERHLSECSEADGARLATFLEDLCAAGMFSGVLFTVAGPDAVGVRTVVSLGSARPERYWITGSVMGRALAFGLNMHEFHTHHSTGLQLSGHLSPEDLEQVRARLTPLQRAVLKGFEQGLDDACIAQRLGVPGEVVDDYRRQLQWHFDARQRALLDVAEAVPAAGWR